MLCPSLPVNGRTVENGVLFVNGVPLAESHMKHHPLTPMHESELVRLMKPQSKYPCRILSRTETKNPPKNFSGGYLIPDYVTDEDAEEIIRTFGGLKLLTGGSGLLTAWARALLQNSQAQKNSIAGTQGNGILLAGSCSKATLSQIAWYQSRGGVSYKLDPAKILSGEQTLDDVMKFLAAHANEDVLFYSSETPEYLSAIRGSKLQEYSIALEKMIASVAVGAYERGYTRIIVAGGETSGAVTKALKFHAYWIGPSIAPGVPMMVPCEKTNIRLVLKSGNFGAEDFFGRALQMTKREDS